MTQIVRMGCTALAVVWAVGTVHAGEAGKGGAAIGLDVTGPTILRGHLTVSAGADLGLTWVETEGVAGESVVIQCPAGTRVLSGGCRSGQKSDRLSTSYPETDTSWTCQWEGTDGPKSGIALCGPID